MADGATMSEVDLSEVIAKLTEHGLSEDEVREVLSPLPLEVVAFDGEHAWSAGGLRVETRGQGHSPGDRACLALGMASGLPVLTTDPRFERPAGP